MADSGGLVLPREVVEALLYGSALSPRFTQDTPILPDVWIRFAANPRQPQELILTPYQDPTGRNAVTAGQLGSTLRRLVNVDRRRRAHRPLADAPVAATPPTATEIAYNQTSVVARLEFEDIVRVVLPFSAWWRRQCIGAQFDALVQHADEAVALLVDGLSGEKERRPEVRWTASFGAGPVRQRSTLTEEFLWMAGIIGTLAAARSEERTNWPPLEPHRRTPTESPPQVSFTAADKEAYHEQVAKALYSLFDPIPIRPSTLESTLVELEGKVLPLSADEQQSLRALRSRRSLNDTDKRRRDALTAREAETLDDAGETVLGDLERREDALTDTDRQALADLRERRAKTLTPEDALTLADLTAARTALRDVNDRMRTTLVYSVSLCRAARLSISRSRAAIKADAARLLFRINCSDLVWAIVDSGIDARHPAFRLRDPATGLSPRGPIPEDELPQESRVMATYDFTIFRQLVSAQLQPYALREKVPALAARLDKGGNLAEIGQDLGNALESGRELDWQAMGRVLQVPHTKAGYRPPVVEHGTHVAGILGADWPGQDPSLGAGAGEVDSNGGDEEFDESALPDEVCYGMCPDIKLYDLRVLDDNGEGDEFNVMAALQFVRHLNQHRDVPVINGVNLSLSIRHDVANFACGRTPICEECERLVGDGIVVVAAAGNEGYMQFLTRTNLPLDIYHSISISDPGNAEGVITVGATHRYEPHTYGVSFFSSRGPTGDGRAKPDLVAPGEKITAPVLENEYQELDGTSMAAPHVSGAAALLMARHRELLGQPLRVKRILCATATDLGRERYFQGAGMVDVLRAIQSV